MATSDDVVLQIEKLLVSSSFDALCHVAQKFDLSKTYWDLMPKLIAIKATRKCFDVSDSENKKALLDSITKDLQQVAVVQIPSIRREHPHFRRKSVTSLHS